MFNIIFAFMHLVMPSRRADVVRWTGNFNIFVGYAIGALVALGVVAAIIGRF